MAKSRTSTANLLGKTLERSSAPAYLVTNTGQIRFANQACANWMGVELNQVLGCQLVYTSQILEDPLQDRLKGLTPPAALFADADGERVISSFWVFRTTDGSHPEIIYRQAHAIGIPHADDDEVSLLVICEARDFSQIPEESKMVPPEHRWHLQLSRLRQQNQLAYSLKQLAGTSPFAHRLRRQVSLAARSSSDLLIVGPPGSGKRHLAHIIHNHSALGANADLIPIESSLASPEMIELLAEALTKESLKKKSQQTQQSGMQASKIAGRNSAGEPAQSGSGPCESWLLLQVDRLSFETQQFLKHWLLESGIGVRLLATSETDLVELAGRDLFDPELAAILSTVTLGLIPLAERLEDIPLLVQAILDQPKPVKVQACIDSVAMAMLCEYRWPGNLDQLTWVVQEALGQVPQERITAEDLPRKFHLWLQAQRVGPKQDSKIDLEDFLAAVEKELLVRAMLQAGGNKTRAAQLLSISRGKLLRRLQHFQIQLSLESQSPELWGSEVGDGGDDGDDGDDGEWLPEQEPEIFRDTTDQADRKSAKRTKKVAKKRANKKGAEQLPLDRSCPVGQGAAENLGSPDEPPDEDDSDLIDPEAFKEVEG
jgi:PAS domain-containing protein